MKPAKIPVSFFKENILSIKFLAVVGLIVLFFCSSAILGNTQVSQVSYHKQSKEINSMNFFSNYETDDFYFPIQDRKKIKFIFLPVNNCNIKKVKSNRPVAPVSGISFTGIV
jgi:hypothetical protein